MSRYPGSDPIGRLACRCWCERMVVWLPPDRVRAGQTASCGRPECRPDDEGDAA